MYLFKAVVMCGQCGEIHNEKWLESKNRHTPTTVLEMLCEPCMYNELTPQDVCFLCQNPWDKCDCFDEVDPIESLEAEHNNRPCFTDELDAEYKAIADLDAGIAELDPDTGELIYSNESVNPIKEEK